jgi:hypothetical protein
VSISAPWLMSVYQGLVQLDVPETHGVRARARRGEHRRRHIDSDDPSLRPGHLRGDEQVGAGATAEVEHHLSWLDAPELPVVRDPGEALDACVGHARELGLGISRSVAHARPVGKMNSCSRSVETSV